MLFILWIGIVVGIVLASMLPILVRLPIALIVNLLASHWSKFDVIIILSISWIIVWLLWRYIDNYMSILLQKIKILIKQKNNKNTFWQKIRIFYKKIENKLENTHNIYIVFLLTVILIQSALPDVIIVRIVRKKFNMFWFIFTFAIGKILTYLPIVIAIDTWMNIINMLK